MKVSIIIPVFNRYDYLKRCIESIKKQDYDNYEIIVVDDGSTENLSGISKICDIYIKNSIKSGPGFSRNTGALRSSGEILLFLDSDTELLPGVLKGIVSIFKNEANIGIVGGSGPLNKSINKLDYIIGKTYSYFGVSNKIHYYLNNIKDKNEIIDCDNIESACLAIKKIKYEELGGFDPYWGYGGEDRDLCLSVKISGQRVVISPLVKVIHYRTISDNTERDKRKLHHYMQIRYMQVALKKYGFMGGIRWVIGNINHIYAPNTLFKIISQLFKYKSLNKRNNTNYLLFDEMYKYSRHSKMQYLRKNIPFNFSQPFTMPDNIVYFITSKCNASCEHCFISEESRTGRNDIKKENIYKMIDSINSSVTLSLTGGEPFLRKDIYDIVLYITRNKHIKGINISSNGTFPEIIQDFIKNIYQVSKIPIRIQMSLDGTAEIHNKIRKIKNGFNKVMESSRIIKSLQQQYSQLSYVVAITIMNENMYNIVDLVDYLEENKINSKLSIVRGNSFSTFGLNKRIASDYYDPCNDVSINPDKVRAIINNISRKYNDYLSGSQKKKIEIMLNTIIEKKRQIPCYAGYKDCVLYSNGDIGICEQVKPFGNLSKWDWNVRQAWNSNEALDHRIQLISCACIHGCNISTSIFMTNKRLL